MIENQTSASKIWVSHNHGFNRENDETMVIRGSFASVLESPLRADLQVLHDTFLAAGGLKHHEGVS